MMFTECLQLLSTEIFCITFNMVSRDLFELHSKGVQRSFELRRQGVFGITFSQMFQGSFEIISTRCSSDLLNFFPNGVFQPGFPEIFLNYFPRDACSSPRVLFSYYIHLHVHLHILFSRRSPVRAVEFYPRAGVETNYLTSAESSKAVGMWFVQLYTEGWIRLG
jgi:hypothetical protein